jgi:hypothetical protein
MTTLLLLKDAEARASPVMSVLNLSWRTNASCVLLLWETSGSLSRVI